MIDLADAIKLLEPPCSPLHFAAGMFRPPMPRMRWWRPSGGWADFAGAAARMRWDVEHRQGVAPRFSWLEDEILPWTP